MAIPSILDGLKTRPSMYLRVVNYDSVAACVQGFDLGTDGEFLNGFGEWLRDRVDPKFHNMSWSVLVLCIAFPESKTPWNELDSAASNTTAIRTLFDCLSEFCNAKNRTNR